ncbi:hypothetical protein L8R84_22805 [Vibrio splendidus]|uniref:hypothetical protein n=1 Tax=Vibrio splendidus TaxID=29497 RepID=UPI0024685C11|nr:hypothetical protein [Vibrio splendidus]MDH5938940.1 hypothetical protein [Vibrio splendidus]
MNNREFYYVLAITLHLATVCTLLGVLIGATNFNGTFTDLKWTDVLSSFGTIIGATATLIAAIFAGLALKSWKQQIHVQRQVTFLDELSEAFNEYSNLVVAPIELVKYSKLAIEGHSFCDSAETPFEESGLIKYIKQSGKEDAERISENLNKCIDSLNKIHALTTKGNMMGFEDYHVCFSACVRLSKTYPAIQAYSGLIGYEYLNWSNPKVEEYASNAMKMDPSDLTAIVKNCNSELIRFAMEKYKVALK